MKNKLFRFTLPLLALCALFGGTRLNAQVQLTADPTQNWIGYMNVFSLPANGYVYQYGQAWGTAQLTAYFQGSDLFLLPNTNVWETNDTYWVQADGVTPNEMMDASFYVQNDSLVGSNLTFSGNCLTNTLTTQPEPRTGVSYTNTAFIKVFNNSYAVIGSATASLATGQAFSVNLNAAISGADHVQYGFETIGPDANPSAYTSLGEIVIAAVLPANPPASPTNTARTPTNAVNSVLAMYDSSGVYPEAPVDDWLASWSDAAEASYTITNSTNVVLKYSTLQYAGVEFYNPDGINVSGYNTMHVDVWTPNANQFGVQLVSLDNGGTQSAQVNFLPAGGKIVTNEWSGLDIPLVQFTEANSSLDLSDLQQLLWIDNQTGGGVTGGIFYIDNVYFYSNAVAPPPLPTPTNNAPTPTQPSANVLAMYDSSGVYPETPVDDWLASWSGASESSYTITNTGNVVLQYGGMEFAGVEFYNPDGLNVSAYNIMHVDLWTPNANQFGIQLVSLDNSATQAGQVNFFPSSGTITSNHWVSLNIPLYEFTAATNAVPGENASPLDLTDLQQMLWIDNQTGGGETGGIFYIDNVYFYAGTTFPQPVISASLASGSVNLSFATEAAATYTVLYKNTLTDPTWQTLTSISGNNAVQTVSDLAGQTSRFYVVSVSAQ